MSWASLGILQAGVQADLVVIDTDREATVSVSEWKSKARLTPWEGSTLKGWPIMTFVEGRMVYDRTRE
jgi:dihydroorotase